MIPLLLGVLVASLAGSMHCAGMCGAFLALAVTGDARGPRDKAVLNAAYHCGRLVTYVCVGMVAGLLGRAVDLGAASVGLQRGAIVVAGGLMMAFGSIAALRAIGVRVGRLPAPPGVARVVGAAHRAIGGWHPVSRAAAIGLLTTLLPCGWLYAFAVTAAGTAHWRSGGLVMAVFWTGTLPLMAALGAGLQAMSGPLRRRLPLLTSALMLGVGAWTVLGRLHVSPAPEAAVADASHIPIAGEAACCHGK